MGRTHDELERAAFPADYAEILVQALAITPENLLGVKDALHHFRRLDDGQAEQVIEMAGRIVDPSLSQPAEQMTFGQIRHMLAERREIAILWGVEDVQAVRPDLSPEQAWDVLRRTEDRHDGDAGITWDGIGGHAEEMFPRLGHDSPDAGHGRRAPSPEAVDAAGDGFPSPQEWRELKAELTHDYGLRRLENRGEHSPDAAAYFGYRGDDGAIVFKEWKDGGLTELPMRNDLRNHSPTGAEWGYSGSGPAQLALAILADAIGDGPALELYQDFKSAVVSGFDREKWELSVDDVLAWHRQQARPESPGDSLPSPADLVDRAGPAASRTAEVHALKPKL
jgi:hypothetical protein